MSGSRSTEPALVGRAVGRRLALVVAVTDYLDTSLRQLRAPAGDAADLRDLLADPDIGGFSVTSVVNERAHTLRVAIEDFLADRHPDDLLLLYLSCHGLVDARRRLYFAARDTFKHRLASSGVESHWLLEQLDDCRARRQVVILDCCFSGAFARGAKGDDDLGLAERLVGDGRGRIVLTASRGTEYSFEGEPLEGEGAARGSVFTSALVEGIRTGRADSDHDGDISVEDAYDYAFAQVRQAGYSQTPQRWLYGAEGSIRLAHVPPELRRPLRAPPPVRSPDPSPPPPAAAVSDDGRPHDLPSTTSQAVGDESRPSDGTARRRLRLLAFLGAAVVAVAALVAVLVTQGRDAPGSTPDDTELGAGSSSGTFTQQSPWRLRMRNVDVEEGCDVEVTNDDSSSVRTWDDLYGTTTFHVRESGTFRYRVNDPGCLLLPQQGDGGVSPLPFTWSTLEGDTPVFESPGAVTVEVDDRHGTPTCDLTLVSDSDGDPKDNREAAQEQTSVRLESNGPGRVYIAATTCSIRVSAG